MQKVETKPNLFSACVFEFRSRPPSEYVIGDSICWEGGVAIRAGFGEGVGGQYNRQKEGLGLYTMCRRACLPPFHHRMSQPPP